jgi:hypothetical protein
MTCFKVAQNIRNDTKRQRIPLVVDICFILSYCGKEDFEMSTAIAIDHGVYANAMAEPAALATMTILSLRCSRQEEKFFCDVMQDWKNYGFQQQPKSEENRQQLLRSSGQTKVYERKRMFSKVSSNC